MPHNTSKIPRHLLPQIPSGKIDEFRKYLQSKNIKSTKMRCSMSDLHPIQKHVNREKVDNLINKPQFIIASPIIVTSDGYIVDGHHRWIAAKELQYDNMNCIVCDCPLRQFLKLAHNFDASYVKSVYELTTYGRLPSNFSLLTSSYKFTGQNALKPRVFEMIKLSTLLSEATETLPREHTDRLFKALKLDTTKVTPEEFHKGMNTELEHIDVTHGDIKKTVLLVLAHLKETPDYYERLEKYVEPQNGVSSDGAPNAGQFGVSDNDVAPVAKMY